MPSTTATSSISTHQPSLLAWLTVERMGYGLALAIALAFRLLDLGRQPMTPDEAAQAWSALAQVRGDAWLPAAGTSPLLFSLHYAAFLLVNASEFWARVWPALVGALTVLLPYGLRRELGRSAALFSAFLLAISASLAFWSRSATGVSLAYFGALALVVCLAGLRRDGLARWAGWTAASLALLLLSPPVGLSALLALAPLAVLLLRGLPPRQGETPREPLVKAVLVFGAVLILGSTASMLRPGGLALLADLPAAWLASLVQTSDYSLGLVWQWFLAEPLLLAAGVAGLVVAWRERRLWAVGLGLWLAVVALLLLRPGRTPADLGLLALPLALLGGQALAVLAAQAARLREEPWEATALGLASLALLGFTAIWLADYAHSGAQEMDRVFAVYAVLGAGLMLLLFVFYALWFGLGVTLRVAAIVVTVALLLPSLRATAQVTLNTDGLRWGSLLQTSGAPDARNIPDFLQDLARQSQPFGGDLRDLPVALVVPPGSQASPLLRWYLRDAAVSEVGGADATSQAQVVVAPATATLPLGPAYSGRSFLLTQTWSPSGLTGGPLARWLLYGSTGGPEPGERAVIWVRQPGQ